MLGGLSDGLWCRFELALGEVAHWVGVGRDCVCVHCVYSCAVEQLQCVSTWPSPRLKRNQPLLLQWLLVPHLNDGLGLYLMYVYVNCLNVAGNKLLC